MPAGATHQLTVQKRRRPGVAGAMVYTDRHAEFDYVTNDDPQAAEVYTLVIDTATNDQVYGLDVTDPVTLDVTYTADATATLAEIADGVADAWNTTEQARGLAEAVSDGVDTITITGVYPGIAFTVAEDEGAADMTLTNTTDAATADAIGFGRAMVSVAYQADYPNPLGLLATSANLTAQVDTVTIVFAAGDKYFVTVEVDDETYTVAIDADTDEDTTADAMVLALNTILPANTVIAADVGGGSGDVTLTAELAGQAFKVSVGSETGDNITLAHTTSGAATDINKALIGIAKRTSTAQQAAIDTEAAEYLATAGVTVVQRGDVWVENTQTIAIGDPVYIELDGTGDDAGKFFNSNSATRARLDSSIAAWKRGDHAGADSDVAHLRINLPV